VTDVNAIVNASVTGASSGPAIRYDAVRLRRGRRLVLDGVTFQVAQGGVVVLMGPSGSGKTTILRTIAGLESFEQGCIDVAGVTLGSGPPGRGVLRRLRRRVGMVFQFHCLFEHMTVLRNVSLAPVHVLGLGAADAEQKARALLQSLGVEHRAGALPRELSGGEAQRVAIARALAVDPPVLLMDEPTASLDRERRSELAWLVRSLVDRHRTLVIATHVCPPLGDPLAPGRRRARRRVTCRRGGALTPPLLVYRLVGRLRASGGPACFARAERRSSVKPDSLSTPRFCRADERTTHVAVRSSMGRRLYVGNLPYSTAETELQELFGRVGSVESVRVMRDAATGRARGFAFVEMATDEEAQKAATELNQYQLGGRALTVNEARPKTEGGFDGGGGYGGKRGGGGGRREPRW